MWLYEYVETNKIFKTQRHACAFLYAYMYKLSFEKIFETYLISKFVIVNVCNNDRLLDSDDS